MFNTVNYYIRNVYSIAAVILELIYTQAIANKVENRQSIESDHGVKFYCNWK